MGKEITKAHHHRAAMRHVAKELLKAVYEKWQAVEDLLGGITWR